MVRFVSSALAVIGFIGCLVVGEPVCFGQKVIAWKLTKGRAFDLVIDQDTVLKLNGVAATTPLKETHTIQRTELGWKVVDIVADGNAAVGQSIERIVFEMKSGSENFVIDTKEPKQFSGVAEIMAKEFRQMAGAKFIATTKPSGEIVNIAFPNANTSSSNLMETGLKEIAVSSSLKLPEKAVQVGDTWQNQYELDMRVFGKLLVNTTYQYLGEEIVLGKTLDKIKATTANRAADPGAKSGLKLTKQESSGTIWFDNKSGCIERCDFQQEMALDVVQAGQTIKQDVKQKYQVKFTPR